MPTTLRCCQPQWLLTVLWVWLLVTGTVRAQNEPIKFGQIDARDLTAAPFAADSGAAAVVLCDFGKASLVSDGQLRFDRVTRIKILKKAGLDWGNVELRLRHELPGYTERVENVEGSTYNLLDGKVVQSPLAKGSTMLLKQSNLYSVEKFALPNVREGSVIEYRYTLFSNYVFTFRSWAFQNSIPVRWSEYRAVLPHQFNYKIFVQTKQPLAVEEQTGPKTLLPTFRWAMRDVPALRTEPYMTTLADYVDKVFFELADYGRTDISHSWDQIDQYVLQEWELGQQLDRFSFLKTDLARLPAPTPDNALLRLAAVRTLVCTTVRCTGELGTSPSVPLRRIYQQTHQGTTAEVNALLIAALRGAGFVANPVLLSTRAHGRVRATMPELSQFNYLAAHVQLPDGQELVLDATDRLLPYDMLPERCLNQQARLVMGKAGTSRWIELKPRYRRIHLQQVQLRLAPDGALSAQVHEEFGGYLGAQLRTDLHEAGEKKVQGRLAESMAGWDVASFAIANRDSVQKTLVMDYAVTQLAPAGSATPGTIYLSPLQTFGLERNPLRAATRQFPVDFGYGRDETLVVNLTLPAGYALAELPKSKALDLPDNGGRYACSVTANGTAVQLTSRLTLRKPIYSAAEYGALRELYQQLLAKQAEKLIVKKQG